jgi:hydroxyacylglutathione hydrolase
MIALVVNGRQSSPATRSSSSVGGGNPDEVRRSVMDVLMRLPPHTRVLPATPTRRRSRGSGRRTRSCVSGAVPLSRGLSAVASAVEATLIVWSRDYDGGRKAWIRFDDGRDTIVGGSRVQRT